MSILDKVVSATTWEELEAALEPDRSDFYRNYRLYNAIYDYIHVFRIRDMTVFNEYKNVAINTVRLDTYFESLHCNRPSRIPRSPEMICDANPFVTIYPNIPMSTSALEP